MQLMELLYYEIGWRKNILGRKTSSKTVIIKKASIFR